jgi:molecular chaperone HscB
MKKVVAGVENLFMSNAYELLGLEPLFEIDSSLLEKKYLECIKNVHPDQQYTKPEEQRKKSLEEAAKINEAYLILKNPLLRAQHLVEIGDKDVGERENFPQEVLTELMRLQEHLQGIKNIDELQKLIEESNKKAELILEELRNSFKANCLSKSKLLIAHLMYLKKFIEDAQEKLWFIEDNSKQSQE